MKDKILTHPMDIAGQIRVIQYSKIPENQEFEFILTAFHHAQVTPYAKGAYLNCSAKPCKDYPKFNIEKDEHIILQFVYKTFINTLLSLPLRIQKECKKSNMAEYDDLYIKFSKLGKKNIKIISLERKQGNKEQVEGIKEMYKLI